LTSNSLLMEEEARDTRIRAKKEGEGGRRCETTADAQKGSRRCTASRMIICKGETSPRDNGKGALLMDTEV